MALSVSCARVPRPQVRSDTHARLLRAPRCLRQLRRAGGVARPRHCPRSESVRGVFVERKPLQSRWDNFIREQEALILKQHRQQTAQYLLLSREPTKLAELDGEAFGLSDRKILRTGSVRWLKALEKLGPESDPIFAPWFAFAALADREFADRAKVLSAKIAANSLARP